MEFAVALVSPFFLPRIPAMTPALRTTLIAGIQDGSIVPYLGCGVLADVRHTETGAAIPADSDSLILAMNNGRPMSPKLMYEFPRAAMNVELKRGRGAVTRFLDQVYSDSRWTRAAAHDWLRALRPPYVIDVNRDTQLQDSYADTPHTLIVGVARISGDATRFRLFAWDGSQYTPCDDLQPGLPILFKPMGTPRPAGAGYIASDADYVDYITELMGGLAIPPTLKTLRQGKRYLLMGLRLNRDTERMVMADIIYAADPAPGWVLISEPTAKEERFCARLGLEIVQADLHALLHDTAVAA